MHTMESLRLILKLSLLAVGASASVDSSRKHFSADAEIPARPPRPTARIVSSPRPTDDLPKFNFEMDYEGTIDSLRAKADPEQDMVETKKESACQKAARLLLQLGSTNDVAADFASNVTEIKEELKLAEGDTADNFYVNVGDRQLVLLMVDNEPVVVKTERHRDDYGQLMKTPHRSEDIEARMYGMLGKSDCENLLSGAKIVDDDDDSQYRYTIGLEKLCNVTDKTHKAAQDKIKNWREKADAQMNIRYMFIPYCGDQLKNFLKKTPMTKDLATEFTYQLLTAYTELHKNGMCHHDLKNDNMCVREGPGGKYTLVLIDYDIGRLKVDLDADKPEAWMRDQIGKYFFTDYIQVMNMINEEFIRKAGCQQVYYTTDDDYTYRSLAGASEEIFETMQNADGKDLTSGDVFDAIREFYEIYFRCKHKLKSNEQAKNVKNVSDFFKAGQEIQKTWVVEHGNNLIASLEAAEEEANLLEQKKILAILYAFYKKNYRGYKMAIIDQVVDFQECYVRCLEMHESYYLLKKQYNLQKKMNKPNPKLEEAVKELKEKEKKEMTTRGGRAKKPERNRTGKVLKSNKLAEMLKQRFERSLEKKADRELRKAAKKAAANSIAGMEARVDGADNILTLDELRENASKAKRRRLASSRTMERLARSEAAL